MRRGNEIASVVAAVALTASFWLAHGVGARLLVMAVWLVVSAAVGGALLVASLPATRPPEQRPQQFVLTRGGFLAPAHPDPRRTLPLLVLLGSAVLAIMLDAHPWFLVSFLAAPIAVAVRNRAAAPHHKRGAVTLTPAGVTIAGRTSAWGEPTAVPRELAVNPWFVSAAIQWYANHPDERPGIGTQEGHDRLRTALAAADPVDPPAPPLPRNLVLGSWLAWTGVTAAILSALGDVVLAFAFRPELERPDPMYPDSGNDWGLIVGFTFVSLTAAALLGVFAIGVLRAVRHNRSESARVLLAILAIGAVAWAINPIGSPILALADSGRAVSLLVICGWILGKSVVVVSAIGTFSLLVSAPARAYTSALTPTATPGTHVLSSS